MKDRFVRFVKRNAVDITIVVVECAVGFCVGYYGAKYVYNLGRVQGINNLLMNGSLKWEDGMPVIKNGVLISGDPGWTPASTTSTMDRWFLVPGKK